MTARSSPLTQQTAHGLAWMAFGSGSQVMVQIAVVGVLARLVDPRDYGLVAAALVAVGLTTILAQSGIGQAIVQRRILTDEHLRAGFSVTVILALVAWAVVAVTAPLVARLFDMAALPPILRAVGATLVLRALTLGDFLLARRLAFRRLAVAELAAQAVGYGGVAIVLALRGYGVWALVGGHLGQAVVRTGLLWLLAPHPIRPLFAPSAVRELLSYGGGHTLARLGNWLAIQGDNVVVGRWLGAAALGLYGRAYQLMAMPAVLFGQVTNDVLFPAMAGVQEDRQRLTAAYRSGVALIALLTFPLAVLAALLSRELVLVLLGERFVGAIAAFDVMAFGIVFRTGYKLSDCLATAVGAVYRRAWRQLCYALAVVAGALIGQQWGIRGVAVGVLLALVVNFLLMAQLSVALLGMSGRSWLAAHAPAALAAAAALAGALPLTLAFRALAAPPLLVVLVAAAAALAAVLGLLRTAPRWSWGVSLADLTRQLAALVPPSLGPVTERLLAVHVAPVLLGGRVR